MKIRQRKLSFEALVDQNKQELLNDKQAMKQIEDQIEKKQELTKSSKLKSVF